MGVDGDTHMHMLGAVEDAWVWMESGGGAACGAELRVCHAAKSRRPSGMVARLIKRGAKALAHRKWNAGGGGEHRPRSWLVRGACATEGLGRGGRMCVCACARARTVRRGLSRGGGGGGLLPRGGTTGDGQGCRGETYPRGGRAVRRL